MQFQGLILAVIALCGVSHVDAYPSGAPSGQCAAMMPSHGVVAQNSLVPYMITTDSQYYTTGQRKMSK